MKPIQLILIFVLLCFAYYYYKTQMDDNGNTGGDTGGDTGGGTDSASSASDTGDGPSSSGGAVSSGDKISVPTTGNNTNNQNPIADTTPTDCEGTWGDWTECDAPCGQYGKTSRLYNITKAAKNGGVCVEKQEKACYATAGVGACPAASPEDAPLPPPQNCVLSDWYKMDPPGCTQPCGPNGTVEWRRHIITSAAYGGTCPTLSKTEACNRHTCPVNCIGAWHNVKTALAGVCKSRQKCTIKEYRISRNKAGAGDECPESDRKKKTECKNFSEDCSQKVASQIFRFKF